MRNGVRYICCVLFFSLAAVVVFPHAARAEIGSVPVKEDIRTDLRTLNVCREGLARTLAFAESRPDLFNPGREKRKGLPSRREKVETWGAWSAVLDYTSALDAVMARHGNFMGYVSGERKRTSFSLLYAAFLAEYRYALEFIALSEKNPARDADLAEFGRSWERPKWHILTRKSPEKKDAVRTAARQEPTR